MKRKFLCLLLALTMVLGLAATVSAAEEIITSGDWSYMIYDGMAQLRYYEGSDPVVTVPAEIDGYKVYSIGWGLTCPFAGVRDVLTDVVISDCVEVIGEQCFYNCESLKNIEFGKNLKQIGARAFINCIALTEMEIPDTVTSLGLRAFNNCMGLKKVVLGSGITEIGSYQFSLCIGLEWITIKSPVTSIGEYAFSECASMRKIFCRFPESAWTEPELGEGNELYDSFEMVFDQ